MNRFYFTYGISKSFPFRGGWTLIYAPNIRAAAQIFKAYHPNFDDSEVLNCADYYSAEEFEKTKMYQNGNFGKFCHEVIGPAYLSYDNASVGMIAEQKVIDVIRDEIRKLDALCTDPYIFNGFTAEEIERIHIQCKERIKLLEKVKKRILGVKNKVMKKNTNYTRKGIKARGSKNESINNTKSNGRWNDYYRDFSDYILQWRLYGSVVNYSYGADFNIFERKHNRSC